MSKNKKAVVITTESRGVFFGYIKDAKKAPSEIVLTNVRMCIYWSADVKGVLGLASRGPTDGCRITQATSEVKLYKVTGILDCSKEAIEAWEKGRWK